MSNKNFEVKHGLSVGGTQRISSAGVGTFTDLNVTGTTTTIDTATLQVQDKNIVINYGSGDTSSTASGAGITIQDAVDASNDATLLWDASADEFDFSHAVTAPSLKSTGASTFDSTLTSTGLLLTENTSLYNVNATISYYSSTNGVYVNGAGNSGWLRLNASGVQNSRTAIDLYGSSGGDYIKIKAGNTDTMYIGAGAAGRVGIGTSSPGSPLEIQSSATNNAGGLRIIQDSGSNLVASLFGGVNSGTRFGRLELSETSGDAVNVRLSADPSQTSYVNAGNFGIGTSNPSTLLHINGSGDAIRVESTNAGSGGAQVDLLHYSASPADDDVHGVINFGGYYSGSSSAYGSSIRSIWSDVSAKKGKMELHTRNDSDFAARMTINEDGYVTLSRNASEYGLELRSAGTRAGLVIATPNSGNTIKASALLLADNTFRLGTQSVYNIHMNQSGHNTMPNQPYMRAYGNYGGMASSHGTTEDPWNHWAVGSSSGITHSNGVFTVPTTGRYLITYSFYNWMDNTGKGVTHAAYLYVGSTNVQETNNEADFEDDAYSYYDNTLSNSIIYNLTAGDTFKFVTYADTYGGVAHTNMSAQLIG